MEVECFFEKVSLVTGGFDPIHSGHISYFKRAKDLSNYLIVGLNTEEWLTRKKGQYFQSWKERAEIIRHLNMVDAVISWDDSDDTAKGAIRKCLEISKQVIFCNGGDRGSSNTPEVMGFANHENVVFKYGVGGEDKMNSSSWILHGYFERQKKLIRHLKWIFLKRNCKRDRRCFTQLASDIDETEKICGHRFVHF